MSSPSRLPVHQIDPDEGFPYVTVTSGSTPPDDPTPVEDLRFWIDDSEEIPLLKAVGSSGVVIPFWPIYVIPHGGSVPSGLHPKTIILEKES